MGIKKLKSGKYQLTYTHADLKKRISFSTKKEAELFKQNIRLRRFTEHLFDRIKIEDAISSYFESRQKEINHLYSISFERFKDHLLNAKDTRLMYVDEIRRSHVIGLRERLLKKLGPSSVNLYIRIYKGFFNYCIDHEWIRSNPLLNIKPLAFSHKKKKLWQTWQQKMLIDCFEGWMAESLYFFCLTGIRPSSIFRLKWSDLNNAKGLITAISFKSRGGARVESTHYLSKEVIQFLVRKKQSDQSNGFGNDGDFIFHKNGKQRSPLSFCQRSKEMIMKLQKDDPSFDGLTIYSFRHTFVSMIGDEHGISVASKAIGHKSVLTTEKFYYSENQSMIESAVHKTIGGFERKLRKVVG